MGVRGRPAIATLARNLRNAASGLPGREAMNAIGQHCVTETQKRMEKGVAPDGTRHKALDPGYVKWKKRKRYSEAIWQLTGDSRRRTGVLRAGVASVRIAINTPYSRYPNASRPVLGLSDKDRKVIKRLCAAEAKKQALGGVGFAARGSVRGEAAGG